MRAVPLAWPRQGDGIQPGDMLSLGYRGKIGRSTDCGFASLGAARCGESTPIAGIYRRSNSGYNQFGYSPSRRRQTIYVLMRTYAPTNPQTPTQQAHRAKMTAAVAAWQSLTVEEKQHYNAALELGNNPAAYFHKLATQELEWRSWRAQPSDSRTLQ